MICDTRCGYCRKGVKSAHGIEAVYMYVNGSGIWCGETISHIKLISIWFYFLFTRCLYFYFTGGHQASLAATEHGQITSSGDPALTG